MEEKSNEDYTPIKYKLKNKELGLNGFYEYKKKTENPNQIELRKITCENYAENTDEENSENTDMKNFKCKDFTKESDVESGKPVVIDLNKEIRYIKFLKDLVNKPDELDDDEDDQLPEGLELTEEETNNTPLYITNKNEYIKQLAPPKGGKRKTRRHRKNSKKNKNRSSKKRKGKKKKRKTVKKRRLRKQK